MGKRREGREVCLQTLYLWDNCKMPASEAWQVASDASSDRAIKSFADQLFEGVISNQDQIDQAIQRYCHNWKLERLASIDRNILRIAVYEIISMPDTPLKVVINEAVEIAKKYSTGESGKFVNGILDKMKSERPHGHCA